MQIYVFLILLTDFKSYLMKKFQKQRRKQLYKMEKTSTKNLKSDHIFFCILRSKNHLSCKYNTLEVIWQYLYYHYCSMTVAVGSKKFSCIFLLSHS